MMNGMTAKRSNPKCVVAFEVDDELHGQASVDLTFLDKTNLKLHTADISIGEIKRMIERKSKEMELRSVLSEVKGFDPWMEKNRL